MDTSNNASEKKVAIVTAAGRGIGEACARELEARGYSLALMSRSGETAELAEELGSLGFAGSVAEEDDLRALLDETLGAYGRVDAVVNNTGHPPTGEIRAVTDDEWHASLDLVFLNVVRMARLATSAMLRQGGGAFVNVSTFSAFEPSAAFPVSSSLRSALAGFAKLSSDRYAAEGIRMNNVLPGFVDSFEVDEQTRATIPMRREGTASEIAKAGGVPVVARRLVRHGPERAGGRRAHEVRVSPEQAVRPARRRSETTARSRAAGIRHSGSRRTRVAGPRKHDLPKHPRRERPPRCARTAKFGSIFVSPRDPEEAGPPQREPRLVTRCVRVLANGGLRRHEAPPEYGPRRPGRVFGHWRASEVPRSLFARAGA